MNYQYVSLYGFICPVLFVCTNMNMFISAIIDLRGILIVAYLLSLIIMVAI